MRFFRNPEVRRTLQFVLPAGTLGWLILWVGVRSAWDYKILLAIAGVTMLIMLGFFLLVLYRHFQNVIRFRTKIEDNQRGHKDLNFLEFSEGEYAILQNKIKSMLVEHFLQEEELQNDKELLSQALADISHQIRTPLYTATLTAQRLAERDVDKLEKELLANRILDMTARIDDFVTMLLKMSRMDAGVEQFRQDTFSAEELVRSACEPVEIIMELKDVRLEKDASADIEICGDKKWLSEALTNILKNCMEHTPPGGTVSICVSQNAVYTYIVIRDTGIGIAAEDLPHVFERYYKGKESSSNSIGIGLAFTNMVIRDGHDGIIKAENNPDGGAKFTIRLKSRINV